MITFLELHAFASRERLQTTATNLRKSQWFGASRVGTLKTVAVPEDHCGVSLCCLTSSDAQGDQYIRHLGLVAWPREDGERCHELKVGVYRYVADKNRKWDLEGRGFSTITRDLRAVLVEARTSVLSITAVPAWLFERYVALDSRVEMANDQHMLELLPDEKIQAIDYGMGAGDVVATVRSRTTHRVSQWFGGCASGEVTPLGCLYPIEYDREKFVCGFRGTKSAHGIRSLGIIVAEVRKPVAGEKTSCDTSNSDFEFCSDEEEEVEGATLYHRREVENHGPTVADIRVWLCQLRM